MGRPAAAVHRPGSSLDRRKDWSKTLRRPRRLFRRWPGRAVARRSGAESPGLQGVEALELEAEHEGVLVQKAAHIVAAQVHPWETMPSAPHLLAAREATSGARPRGD